METKLFKESVDDDLQVPDWSLLHFLNEVQREVNKARQAFPTNEHLIAAATEEFGELIKAVLDHTQKDGSEEAIHKEGVQAAAMVARLVLEGDPSVKYQGM